MTGMSAEQRPAGALDGLRVLELGELVSAPYATKLLADLGAEVIKVEPPSGERARHRGPYRPDQADDLDASGLYLALNTNKQSIVIEPTGDPQPLSTLAADADLVVTNLSPDLQASFGFDADRLRHARPELTVCTITPFGLTGPRAGWVGEELTVTNAGGWAYQSPGASEEIDQPPLKVFGHQADFHAGTAAAMVSITAWQRAQRSGQGDHIDLSSVAHIAGMIETALIAASYQAENSSRLGARLLNPWKIFDCRPKADGDEPEQLFLVTIEQDQWERLVEVMGRPDWVETGLFDTVEDRLANDDLLNHFIGEWTATQDRDELWHRCQQARVCTAPVLDMGDLGAQGHLADRNFLVDVEHPRAGTVRHLGPCFLDDGGLRVPLRAAPLLDPAAKPRFTARSTPATASAANHPDRRPLDGVRVIDLSWVWAGPYATFHLAALGAEVIKIESAKRPGLGRRLPLHPDGVEPTLNTCCYFNQWDQAKLSCQLDLSSPGGVDIVRQLVAESDVVVENFATGVMDKLGLGYQQLSAINPGLIMASISGYGSAGPLRHYMGYGPTTGPLSGLSSLTGYRHGPAREMGISVGDPAAGITAALAVVAALAGRRQTDRGCYLDVALWEATASFAVEGWMTKALVGHQLPRAGNRDPLMAPHNCYRCEPEPGDGELDPDPGRWLSIACADDRAWQALAAEIDRDRPDHSEGPLVADTRFATGARRKANEDALDQLVAAWTAERNRWELAERLQAAGVAAHPSMSPLDLLDDAHLEARGFFARLDHPEVGVRTHTGLPWRSATDHDQVPDRAPLLGEHTAEVLGSVLGLTAAEITDLEARGVIA